MHVIYLCGLMGPARCEYSVSVYGHFIDNKINDPTAPSHGIDPLHHDVKSGSLKTWFICNGDNQCPYKMKNEIRLSKID
jgi:hypothetical protein